MDAIVSLPGNFSAKDNLKEKEVEVSLGPEKKGRHGEREKAEMKLVGYTSS